jgi:nitroreductase
MRYPVEAGVAQKPAFPAWAGSAERLRFLLRYAVRAPSRYNTQPWLFEIEGSELRVYGDWRRALKVADPQGRELVMACGAALYNLEVAALHFGHATSVEVVASADRRDGLLARLALDGRRPPTAQNEELFAAIGMRRTNRFAFDARDVPFGVVTGLVREAAYQGACLRVVDRTIRPAVSKLVAEGARQQWASARFRSELATWSRSNEPGEMDGVPGYARGLSDSASVLHRVLVRFRMGLSSEERRDRYYALNTRALLALCSHEDGPADWFVAGQAIQRVLLSAAAKGLSASFFSQTVEVPSVRTRLRDTLGELGWPQLLFRLGYGRPVRPTPRRPVDLVLRSMSSSPPYHAVTRHAAGAGS